jgi:oligopeptide transport system ATP-binding protein
VVRALADYVLVIKDGRVIEEGDTDGLFKRPRSAHARTLIAASTGEFAAHG